MTLCNSIILIILGWLLGLLAPLITNKISNLKNKSAIKGGIVTELNEIRYKLVCAVIILEQRFGIFNKELLEWAYPIVEDYKGFYIQLNVSKYIKELQKLTGDQLSQYIQSRKIDVSDSLSLKKHYTPFIDSKLQYLTLFSESSQSYILEVKTQLALLNEEVDQYRFYYQKTFDSTLSSNNRTIITKNIDQLFKNYAHKARMIADRISQSNIT